MGRLELCTLNKQITIFREQALSVLPWSNSNLEVLVFVEAKTVEPGEKPSEQGEKNNKLNPHMTLSRNRTRPHWWEASLEIKTCVIMKSCLAFLWRGERRNFSFFFFFFHNELYIVFLYFTFRLMKVNPQWSGYPGYTFRSLTWQPLCKPPVGRTAGHWIAPLSTLQSPNTGPQRRWLRGHIPVVLWVDCTWKGPRGTWRRGA